MQLADPSEKWRCLGGLEWPPNSGNQAGSVWEHKLTPIRVMRSKTTLNDESTWIHLSISRHDRLPSWEEISKVKNEFLGAEIEAYQVLAARQDHINVHKNCLHLWAPLDGIRKVANLMDIKWEEAV